MLSKHYAPKTKTIVTENIANSLFLHENKRVGLLTFQNRFEHTAIVAQEVLSPNGNLEEAATHLYNALHQLDQMQIDIIIAEKFPQHDLGRTINDRLARATKK